MTIFGNIRTSCHLQEGVAGMGPLHPGVPRSSQEFRLREASVHRDDVYRDIGVSGGDTLVMVRIFRIGWRGMEDTRECNERTRRSHAKFRATLRTSQGIPP